MIRKIAAAILAVISLAMPASAQQQDTSAIEKLRRQIDALSREIEAMRLGEDVVARADTTSRGLGPAASKVYRARQGVSLGGYGEVLLRRNITEEAIVSAGGEEEEEEGGEATIDALRFITYVGYKFNPKLVLNSEIEFEHASTEYGGSVSVEFAYLDWTASSSFGVRGGLLLMPMGFLNELHEPPIFLGTTRPLTEQSIIPSTWRENGVGVFGESRGFSYRAYLTNGFDAVGGRFEEAEGFSAHGLRGGRQSGSEALFGTPAVVARLDYTATSAGLMLGGSAYLGNSVPAEMETPSGIEVEASTKIFEGHAQYRNAGLELRGLAAFATVGDVVALNQVHGFTGEESIGDRMHGFYVQAGYDLFRNASNEQQLIPYVRFEKLNTQARVPNGFLAAPENNRTVTTLGAMWKPILNIALKADYQINTSKAGSGVNQLNVSMGYLF